MIDDPDMTPTVGDSGVYTENRGNRVIGSCFRIRGSYIHDSHNVRNNEFQSFNETTFLQFESRPRSYDSFDFYSSQTETILFSLNFLKGDTSES